MKLLPVLLSLALGATSVFGQGAKTAVFVNNLAGSTLEGKAPAFQAMLDGKLTGSGYSVINQDAITATLAMAPPNENNPATMLATQSSAQRLAQLVGADYILVANLVSLGGETKTFEGNGISTINKVFTLRVAYGLLDAAEASGFHGDSFAVTKTLRDDGNLKVDDQDLLNGLLDDAATKIAAQLTKPEVVNKLPAPTEKASPITFSITAVLQGIKIPNVLVGLDNQVKTTETRFPVEALGVDVELDGVVQGSAPGEFGAMPGLHKLRLTREGFQPWERNVNLYEGFALTAALDLTPEGLAQWKDLTEFVQDLQTQAQMTAAQVKVLEGKAQAMRQSGFLVNTTDAPVLNMFNSLWGPPFLEGIPEVE